MKIITAMIRPFLLSRVTTALEEIDCFSEMTISDVTGIRKRKGASEWRAQPTGQFKKEVFIEVVAADSQAQQIIATLVNSARTENSGEGRVFTYPITAAHIQSGDIGDRCTDATLTLLSFNDFRIFHIALNR